MGRQAHCCLITLATMSWLCLFVADLGGFFGLFLGGSAISAFELIDFIVYNAVLKIASSRRSRRTGERRDDPLESTPDNCAYKKPDAPSNKEREEN